MAGSAIVSASELTRDQFDRLLDQYDKWIDQVASEHSSRRKFLDLDAFRYVESPTLCSEANPPCLDIATVTKLVEWKLMHGKFRPNLLKLARSNHSDTVHELTASAFKEYSKTQDVKAAVKALSALRGIGPATASLLLSVHDPQHVVFFSDEAFQWLVSSHATIKYTPKEYEALQASAERLRHKLGVTALQIEKVAFVMMRQGRSDGYVGKEQVQANIDKKVEDVQANQHDDTISSPRSKTSSKKRSLVDEDSEAGSPSTKRTLRSTCAGAKSTSKS